MESSLSSLDVVPPEAEEGPSESSETPSGGALTEASNRERSGDLNRSPGEIAFFKLLHAELKKATFFFEKAQQEFLIREERVREGSKIMEQANSIMVNEKWSLLAKSIFRLYKDLLLFETFAIMTYCSFSKILKKHDKVTGHNTRTAFMANVVNKANFTSYPKVMEMIRRCESLYDSVSHRLVQEGKEGLYEDERLFINMISRLNEQALNTAEGEGAPHRGAAMQHPQVVEYPKNDCADAASSLKLLVEENDAHAAMKADAKRPVSATAAAASAKKPKR